MAMLIVYKTNFFKQLWENQEINSFFLTLSMVALGLNISFLAYLTIYGPCVLGKDIDLEKDMPAMVPIMALSGVISFFCIILAGWPVWGIFTPIYIMVMFFGGTFSMVFMPSGNLGNLTFWIVFLGGAYYAHNMEHKPDW